MRRNLTTNSFAIAKHDTCSILRKMFTQFFLSIILAVSFQSTVLADITQADLDKLGAKIIDTTHGKLSIIDINKHPQRDEILDAMTEAQFKDFSNWQVSTTQAIKEENKRKDAFLQELIEEGKRLDAFNKAKMEEIAIKSNALVVIYKRDLANGKKLQADDRVLLERLLKPEFDLRKHGMTQATYDYLTELLRNSKNFE